MATIELQKLSGTSVSKTIVDVLSGDATDKATVNNALNGALKTVLVNAASGTQQTALVNLLQTLSPAELAAEQNLSLRDFVTKNTKLPTDPAAKQAAQEAIASLSSSTTVGAMLGLNGTVANNPIFGGIIAQTNLSALLSTSSTLAADKTQTDFIAKYTSFQGTSQDFWTQLAADDEFKSLVPELQFTMQLGVLTLNNAALVAALRNTYKPTSTRDLTKVEANSLTQLITSQSIAIPDDISGSTPAEKTANYVGGIMALLQAAFPTDYVAQALAASTDTGQQAVAKFLTNSPDFDFQTTPVDTYIQQNAAKSLPNATQDQISAVSSQLKSIQRIFRISPDYLTINTLLTAGLDSASKIARLSRAHFVGQYSASLGGEPQALAVYTTAGHINAQAVNLYRTIQAGLNEVSPVAIKGQKVHVPPAIQTGIPNWQTLFGNTSGCQCDDCLSVYSAAAYFVDLLEFLRHSRANAAGFTPLDVLIGATHGNSAIGGRRPDLPFIKLDCQNTNTELPYIDLVNEILESYIVLSGKLDRTTAHNTPLDATADELSVNPEYTLDSAYTSLTGASYPLTLPYDRFLDVTRRYLGFLGGNRLQVIQAFQTSQSPVDTAAVIAAEVLGLSHEEFQLIAGWDYLTGSSATLPPLYALYGYSAASITRTVDSKATTQSWEQWVAAVPEFLIKTGLQFSDLVNLLATQFINPGQTITISSAVPCDITQAVITPLSDATLANILPFVRLWTKLGWSMSDVDKVLAVLGPKGITRGFLVALAEMQQLQGTLNLSVSQILTLWGSIGTDGRNSLYITLFQNKAVLNPVDANLAVGYRAALSAAPTGLPASVTAPQISYDAVNQQVVFTGAMTDDQWTDMLAWAGTDAAKLTAVQNLYRMRWAKGTDLALVSATIPPTITGESPAILAALRISADDLDAIRTAASLLDTQPPTPVAVPLNLTNLSVLYRYAILAESLGMAIGDLISLVSLTGINPFQLASTDPVTNQTVRFVQAAQTVLASGFSVAQLNFLYRAVANPAAGVGPLETNVDVLVLTMQAGLQKIAASNTYISDPNGKFLRQKLGVLLGGSDLSAAMDLISGTAIYSTSLVALPSGVSFGVGLAGLVSYDTTNQLMAINGPMSDTVKSELTGLSADGTYLAAVNSLYGQPRDVLANALSFLNTVDATAQLINSPSASVSDRYDYVLGLLLTFLTDTQSRSLVKQALSQALSIDAATTSLLLDVTAGTSSPALLSSQRDPSQPAIVDFLDVRDGGLLATYFSDTNLSAPIVTQIDQTVKVGAGGTTVTNPGGTRWLGKLLPQFSESYTFYVNANDGVRLWLNDQLLIDQWSNQGLSTRTSAPLNLNAGQLYDLRLDYYNASAAANVSLGWSSKSTNKNVNAPIPQSALFPINTFNTLLRLYPIGILLSTFGMKSDEVAYLSANSTDFSGVDPNNSANKVNFDLTKLPVDRSNATVVDTQAVAFFNQWLHLNDLYLLRNALPSGNVTIFDVFRTASSSIAPTQLSVSTVSTALAVTGWDPKEFATLTGKTSVAGATVGFGLTDADFRNAQGQQGTGLVWLKRCLDLSNRLGISTAQLFSWGNTAPNAQQAQDIKSTVKAKYDDSTWLTVGAPLNNQIRDDSKAALIAYVLTLPTIVALGYSNADELYEYFLIDVGMSSCRLTSRIVQATAAVQLFIQRCFLNLENDNSGASSTMNVSPDAIDFNQWQWRQNYRVWEANREVFLYPENYIDPTLRDNATPFFVDLQTELQQGPVTAERAETAFQNYLKKVQEVARLEISGLYWEVDTDSVTNLSHNIFHVFARTAASPQNYYYRTYNNSTSVWSPWESVAADIEGDHLIPVIWNRRLHLFWPVFKEQTTPNTATSDGNVSVPPISTDGSATSAAPSVPLKNLQIQLAWSEYRDGGWTKKQTTPDFLVPDGFAGYQGDLDPSILSFNAVTSDAQLTVSVFCWGPYDSTTNLGNIPFPDITPSDYIWAGFESGRIPFSLFKVGSISFDGCSATPAISPASSVNADVVTYHAPVDSMFSFMELDENYGQTLAPADPSGQGKLVLLANASSPAKPVVVLNATPTAYALNYPQQFYPSLTMQAASPFGSEPFFYADDMRTYLVTEETVLIPERIRIPLKSLVPYTAKQLSDTGNLSALPKLPIFDQKIASQSLVRQGIAAPPALSKPAAESTNARIAKILRTQASLDDTVAAAGSGTMSTEALILSVEQSDFTLVNLASKYSVWQSYFGHVETLVEFSTHRHPYVCDFLKALNWQGVPGLLTLSNQQLGSTDVEPKTIFQTTYKPTSVVAHPYPSENVDFSTNGAYSIYNWEIFFHIPFLIATQLGQNMQFDDAETYFRYIINLTSNSKDPIPSRYWNVLPFYQDTEQDRISDLVTALQYTGTDATLLKEKSDFAAQIVQWEQTPFDPDLIARMRISAYQKAIVMKYMDHHFAWADFFYAQYTPEYVNEATLHYVLIAELLGDKPVIMPPQGVILDQTYNQLVTDASGLDSFSDELVTMENLFPFSTDTASSNSDGSGSNSVSSVAQVPYFCIPVNDTLLGYWDKVAQRLFQIRHCMNISGQVQQLPLFAPPINPGMLIQALAMGMDLSSALGDINAATPYYRFAYMLPKTLELCSELRALGGALLSALEKSDGEAIAMVRATQETDLMKAILNVKQQQLNEANANLTALSDSLQITQARHDYYQNLIKTGLSSYESGQVSLLNDAMGHQSTSQQAQLAGSAAGLAPNLDAGLTGVGGSPTVTMSFGGSQLAAVANFIAQNFSAMASLSSSSANITGLQGGWDRRGQDWAFQLQTASLELTQIGDQIKAATARQALAQADLDNQGLQISNASDIQDFLRTKYTNQALYDWMVSQVSAIYFQCYQMTYTLAKGLEACFIFELMPDPANYAPFIEFGYWDSLRKGLLSGERLYQDVKRLEIAYMDQNQRDYEITKSISLLLLDPVALINLKETGQCTVQFPEALFDMDYPGHYLRRIKSVSLTIPCVVGPYTSVNCTLTLVSNKIRIINSAADVKDYVKDSHFLTNFAASESIATSSGQNDSGMFAVNFGDERYLPFEGAGAVSTWQLSMPQDNNAIDFETISDVIFILKYTSRSGAGSFGAIAKAAAVLPPGSLPAATLIGTTAIPPQTSATRLFSLRHEFPTDWYNFLNPLASSPDQSMTLNLVQDRFPFRYRGKKIQIYQVDVFLIFKDIYNPAIYSTDGSPLGDYAAKGSAGALQVNVTPPGGTAKPTSLVSNSAILQRVPFGTIPQPAPPLPPPAPPALGPLGAWTVLLKGADIQNIAKTLQSQVSSGATTIYRLDPTVVEDVLVVCHFSTL